MTAPRTGRITLNKFNVYERAQVPRKTRRLTTLTDKEERLFQAEPFSYFPIRPSDTHVRVYMKKVPAYGVWTLTIGLSQVEIGPGMAGAEIDWLLPIPDPAERVLIDSCGMRPLDAAPLMLQQIPSNQENTDDE